VTEEAAARQRKVAERRLLNALTRFHRREPLRHDIRTDALLAHLREEDASRPPARHRGGQPLLLDDSELLRVLDDLVARGEVERHGRRVRLAGQGPRLDSEMRERIDRLLGGLREAGYEPPRVDAVAARLGVPPGLVEALRRAGTLVSVAPGIDYSRAVWDELRGRLARMAASGPLTIARVRRELRVSRRYAEAILDAERRERVRERRRAPGG
jgi:hypothetical protein